MLEASEFRYGLGVGCLFAAAVSFGYAGMSMLTMFTILVVIVLLVPVMISHITAAWLSAYRSHVKRSDGVYYDGSRAPSLARSHRVRNATHLSVVDQKIGGDSAE